MLKSLVDPTPEILEEITRLAALFFTPREIAIMQELPADDFVRECACENSNYYTAFQSGRLQSEVDLRTSILKLAKSGSSPAQTMSLDMLNKSKGKMLDR
jgi:hypothetical protein